MKKRTAVIGAAFSLMPLVQSLVVGTGAALTSAVVMFSVPDKAKAESANTYKERGDQKFSEGDLYGAISDFNKAIEIDPKYANAYGSRCGAKLNLRMNSEALKDCEKAILINQEDSSIHLDKNTLFTNLCGVKVNLKDFYGAISDCNKAISLDSKDGLAFRNRGIAKEEIGDMQGACSDWKKGSSLGEEDAAMWVRNQC